MKKKIILMLMSLFMLVGCGSTSYSTNNVTNVKVYLELGVDGLYNGEIGHAIESKKLVNAVAVNYKVGDSLPNSDVITSADNTKIFSSWEFCENDEEIPTIVFTVTAKMNNQALFAKWKNNEGQDIDDDDRPQIHSANDIVDLSDKYDTGSTNYNDVEEEEVLPSDFEEKEIDDKTAQEYEKDLYIGYGYDITCKCPIYDKENSIPRMHPILNFKNSTFVNSIKTDPVNSLVAYNKKTASQKEMLQEYGNSVSGGINASVAMVNTSIETVFDTSHSTKTVQKESYEIYSMILKKNRILSQLSVNQLKSCLSNDFKTDLYAVKNEASAMQLFNNYGTHLIRGYTLGGVLNVTNYFGSYSSSYNQRNTLSIKQQLSAAIGAVNAGESFSFENTYGSEENLNQCVSNYAVSAYGGNGASLLTIDNLFTYNQEYASATSSGYEYGRWVNSINEGIGLTIVSIPNQTAMLPLWNLLPSTAEYSSTKEILINTYIKNCKSVYDEYIAEHPDCEVNAVDEEQKDFDLECSLKGITETKGASGNNTLCNYIETPDSFDTKDISIQKGSTVSLDIESNYSSEKVEWYVDGIYKDDITFISSFDGLFKVNEQPKNSSLILNLKVNDVYCRSIEFKLNDVNSSFPLGGSGTEIDPYLIGDKDTLKTYLEKGNYYDKYVKLVENIDFNNEAIDVIDAEFKGNFDGNYCNISNFVIYNKTSGSVRTNYGLFSKNSGTIKNVFIDNANVFVGKADNYTKEAYKPAYRYEQCEARNIGVISASNTGSILNCYVKNSAIVNGDKGGCSNKAEHSICMGLIAGYNSGTISRVSSRNNTIHIDFRGENTGNTLLYNGGIAGQNDGKIEIAESKTVTINVYSKLKSTNQFHIANAGISGITNSDSSSVQNCVVKDITLYLNESETNAYRYYSWQAGLIARYNKGTVSNCAVNAKISFERKSDKNPSEEKIGLAFGRRESDDNVTNCYAQNSSNNSTNTLVGSNKNSGISKTDDAILAGKFSGEGNVWTNTYEQDTELCIVIDKVTKLDVRAEKRDFYKGQFFNPGKILVTATLSTGTTIDINQYKVDKINKELDAGDTNITVSACGNTGTYDISVKEPEPVSISVNLEKTTTQYYIGQAIQKDKIVFNITYNNWQTKEVSGSSIDFKIIETDYNLGKNLIHIQYGDLETSFVVIFIENGIEKIFVDRVNPSKTYAVGDYFLASDIKVTVLYKDGTKEIVKSSKLEILNDIIFEGINIITIVYDAYFTATVTIKSK